MMLPRLVAWRRAARDRSATCAILASGRSRTRRVTARSAHLVQDALSVGVVPGPRLRSFSISSYLCGCWPVGSRDVGLSAGLPRA